MQFHVVIKLYVLFGIIIKISEISEKKIVVITKKKTENFHLVL